MIKRINSQENRQVMKIMITIKIIIGVFIAGILKLSLNYLSNIIICHLKNMVCQVDSPWRVLMK